MDDVLMDVGGGGIGACKVREDGIVMFVVVDRLKPFLGGAEGLAGKTEVVHTGGGGGGWV